MRLNQEVVILNPCLRNEEFIKSCSQAEINGTISWDFPVRTLLRNNVYFLHRVP